MKANPERIGPELHIINDNYYADVIKMDQKGVLFCRPLSGMMQNS